MQKPRLVLSRAALAELQERVMAQYLDTGRRVKYARVLGEYRALAQAREGDGDGEATEAKPAASKYTLAQ